MATFTMKLKTALELSGGVYETVEGRTIITGGDIGLNFYPIFDETYRETLNGLIFDHYMNEEIGSETLSMFQLRMRSRMNLIMPQINQIYESTLLNVDPFKTVDISNEQEATATGTATASTTATATAETESETGSGSRNVSSTTPQVMLSGSGDYASSAADSTGKTTVAGESSEASETENSTNTQTVNDGSTHTTGFQGHMPELLARYRDSLINVDAIVIDAIKDLFMLVWGTNETYTNNNLLGYN